MFILHLRIPISSSSLLLIFISSFIISTWIFLPHLRIFISSTSLLLLFTSSFIISALFFLQYIYIPIYSYLLMLLSLHCGMLELKFELEVLLVAWLFWVFLFTEHVFFGEGLDVTSFLFFFGIFTSVQLFNLRCTLLTQLIFQDSIYHKTFFT